LGIIYAKSHAKTEILRLPLSLSICWDYFSKWYDELHPE